MHLELDQCESCDGTTLRTISGNYCLCPAGYYDQINEPNMLIMPFILVKTFLK